MCRKRRRDRVAGGDQQTRADRLAWIGRVPVRQMATALDVDYIAVRHFQIGAASIYVVKLLAEPLLGGKPG
jgi:hypothetical protein